MQGSFSNLACVVNASRRQTPHMIKNAMERTGGVEEMPASAATWPVIPIVARLIRGAVQIAQVRGAWKMRRMR